jgi:hypothetical protein
MFRSDFALRNVLRVLRTVLVLVIILVLAYTAAQKYSYLKPQIENGLSAANSQMDSLIVKIAGAAGIDLEISSGTNSGGANPGGLNSAPQAPVSSAPTTSHGNQPLPTAQKITSTPPETPSNGSVTSAPAGDFGDTGMPGLKVYEYGRTLLNAAEQSCYSQIAVAVQNLQTPFTINTSLTPTDVEKIYQYYINDHVELFYVNGVSMTYTYAQNGSQTAYKSYTFSMQYAYDKNTAVQMRSQMGADALKMLSAADGKSTEYGKELALHDEVVNAASYDTAALQNPNNYPESFTDYGIFVNKTAVCEGYAKAMKLLLDSAGIESLYISGTASNSDGSSGPHAWNMARISGKWYYLDATFDDPIYVNSNGQYIDYNKPDYTYFNFTSKSDHQPGTFDAADPFDGNSQNYAVMPNVG